MVTDPPTKDETALAVVKKDYSLQLFLLGLFSSNTEKYFPLNKVSGGLTLQLNFAQPRYVYHTSKAAGAPDSYTISNMSFIMDTVQFDDPAYDQLLNEKIANEGLTYFTDSYTNQNFQVPAASSFSAITQKVYSSLKGIYFCQQRATTISVDTNNIANMDINALSQFNISIGSKQLPGAPIKAGSHAYAELRKSFNKLNYFTAGGLITKSTYNSISAIFGVNFQNHLGLSRNGLEMISGVTTSDPLNPLTLQLDLYASSVFTAATLYLYMHYDLAYHITPDGRIVSTYQFNKA